MENKTERSPIKKYLIVMSKLERSREGVTTAEIAQLCGITTRSARRFMDNLSLHAPIYKEGRRWYLLRGQL